MANSKARPPTLAQVRFREDAEHMRNLDLRQRFERIFETNLWAGQESRSGVGSAVAATVILKARLLEVIRELKPRVLLDLPCGDFNWIAGVADSVDHYIGADIVRGVVERNNQVHPAPNRKCMTLDLTRDPLPAADLILCRDCLVHLSFQHCFDAIENMKRSGSRWLLATTFTDIQRNTEIEDGDWRALNMQESPFGFPVPEKIIVEGCTEENGAFWDKSLGLWKLSGLVCQA